MQQVNANVIPQQPANAVPKTFQLIEMVDKVRTVAEMREVLMRNGWVIAENCPLVTSAYCRALFQAQLWAPHSSRIHYRICFKPPPLLKLVEIVLELCTQKGLNCGISMEKRNFPTVQWALLAIMELDPNHAIFARDYVPPKATKNARDVEIQPIDGLMDGLEHLFLGRNGRAKHGRVTNILTKEQLLQVKVSNYQSRLETQSKLVSKTQGELQSLQNRGVSQAQQPALNERESVRLRELEAQYQQQMHLQAQEWQRQQEATMTAEFERRLAEAIAAQSREQPVETQFDPLRIENQEMHSATLNEVSLDYQNRTRAQRKTVKTLMQ